MSTPKNKMADAAPIDPDSIYCRSTHCLIPPGAGRRRPDRSFLKPVPGLTSALTEQWARDLWNAAEEVMHVLHDRDPVWLGLHSLRNRLKTAFPEEFRGEMVDPIPF